MVRVRPMSYSVYKLGLDRLVTEVGQPYRSKSRGSNGISMIAPRACTVKRSMWPTTDVRRPTTCVSL